MPKEYKHPVMALAIVVSVLAALTMLYFHAKGYSTSLDWSLSAETQLEEITAYSFQKGPVAFELKGEKATLLEAYTGEVIDHLPTLTTVFLWVIFVGLALLTASATYFRQTGFLVFSGVFLLFLFFLRLPEYFGTGNWVMLAAFLPIIGVAFVFHAFWYQTTFAVRVVALLAVFVALGVLMPGGIPAFSNHFLAYSAAPLLMLGFVFVAFIAEEIIYALLHLLTRNKTSQSNFHHLMILGGLYVANLIGYYLNKANIFSIGFTFLNPYMLMVISFGVALWSFRYKYALIEKSLLFIPAFVSVLSLGIVTFAWMGLGFARGLDGIYEGMHYIIVYAHLGFGFFFLAYIVINFIDPLFKGLQVFKIVYKPQSFHYVSARLAGFAAAIAFFAVASKAPLNLVTGVKYSLLADTQMAEGNVDLAVTYYKNADAFGYNAHYTNYSLGHAYLTKGNTQEARRYFQKATERFPSAQAFLNTSNLQPETNTSLATTFLTTGLQYFPDAPELKNNLGLIHLKNERYESALANFDQTESDQEWNQAPTVNKWATLDKLHHLNDEPAVEDYTTGNLAVKTNVLAALLSAGMQASITFPSDQVSAAWPLHRQAFLLNSAYFFTDTTLHRYLKTEINQPQPGMQQSLRKALARNLYLSGRVREAFQTLDYIQQGTSGYRAGEVFNEMGLLALDQHAPLEALDLFDKALENGYADAAFNRAIALLEAGRFDEAKKALDELADEPSANLASQLQNVFVPASDTSATARFNALYYRCMEGSPAELKAALKEFTPESQAIVLRRVAEELENKGASEAEYAAYGISPPSFDGLSDTEMIEVVWERPFDETLLLKASEKMDPTEAYRLLQSALEFNPYSITLLKAHALSAIDLNLPEYARPSIEQLSQLLSVREYLQFEQEWYRRKAAKEAEWPY